MDSLGRTRAQGTFEYVLLLGGVLLTVVVALVVLQGSFQQSATGLSDVQLKQCKVSAQQAPSCFSGSAFQGGNTFSSLSVPEGTFCNCSNYDPNSFSLTFGDGTNSVTLPGGGSGLAANSELLFDDASASVFLNSESGELLFASAPSCAADYTFTIAPTTISCVNGNAEVSWSGLLAGTKVRIGRAKRPLSDAQKQAAVESVRLIKPTLSLKASALSVIEKNLDASTSFSILRMSDGRLSAIISYLATVDLDGSLSIQVPLPANRIYAIRPVPTSISASGTQRSLVKWDQLHLSAGRRLDVVVDLSPDFTDATAASSLADLGIQQALEASPSPNPSTSSVWVSVDSSSLNSVCAPSGQSCLPLAGKSCCSSLGCDPVDFLCKPLSTPTPTASPSVQPSIPAGIYVQSEKIATPFPFTALLVQSTAALSAKENAFLLQLKDAYGLIHLVEYNQASSTSLMNDTSLFIIESNDALSASVILELFKAGHRVNLLGTAATYADQITIDATKIEVSP